jgi:phosphoglycolate phosphatase-like HAD superfamily hydrolase
LIAGAREALEALRSSGFHLYLWSSMGADYTRRVAVHHQLEAFFEGFLAKPDIVIDDVPSSTVSPYVYRVHDDRSWPAVAEKIIRRHTD